ncbi:MAG: hypothetical protein WD271_08250 [Acidimicrobiia bacterium]
MVTAQGVLDRCTIDLLGLPTELAADEPRAAHALASVLGAARLADAQPSVRVRACSSAPAVPAAPPTSSTPEFETWRPVRGELVLRHRSGLTARATSTAIDIGGNAVHFDASFRRTLLSALAHLLSQHDRSVVHGAAIATDGRAVLVLGGTGSGKSTLAVCALRAGWDVLADDLVALRGSSSSTMIGGVPRPLAVPSDVLDDDPFDTQPIADDQRGRRELPPNVVASGWYPLVGAIVVDHAREARGAVERIDSHALLHDLLGSWAPLEDPRDVRQVLPLASAVARSPAAVVRLGRDPATRAADAAASLEEVRSRFGLLA